MQHHRVRAMVTTGRSLTALQLKEGCLLSYLLGNLHFMASSMSFGYMNYQLSQIGLGGLRSFRCL